MNKNVAIYARVSTIEQVDKYSIGEQIDKLKKYCELQGWSIHKEYIDGGFSGSNLNRPAMDQMIKDAERNKFDGVVVFKLDRLSRSIKDAMHLIDEVFDAHNVFFLSLTENFDTSTPIGKAMIAIMSVFAQLEREQIKERFQMGKLGRAKDGKPMNWTNVSFGYKYVDGELFIDDVPAMIIRDVFETYLAGGTLDGIARKLNAEGHIGKEKLWVPQTVKNVLHNSIYAGYNYHRGERYKGNHAPIITLEMWEKVQEIMKIKQQEAYSKGNTGRPWQSKYMLSGLLRCGICGAALKLFSNQLRTDGTRSISYKCVSTMPKSSLQGYWQAESCNGKSHMREPIESEILEWVEVLRRNPEMIEKNNDNESVENDIKIIEDKIGDIDKKTELLVDLYLDAKIERDIFDKRKGTLNEERESCLTKIDKLKESLKSDDNYKTAKEVLSSIGNPIRTYDEATQKKIVRQLVDHIEVSNDQTKIVWRF